MIIAGAGGHALEVLDELERLGTIDLLCFFDEINKGVPKVHGKYEVLYGLKELEEALFKDNRFFLGVGSPKIRERLYKIFISRGGKFTPLHALTSRISPSATGVFDALAFSFIGAEVELGIGTLINVRANIHHQSMLGNFVEVSPGALVLGKVKIGDFSKIGAGSVILPGIQIGKRVTIGAGAVVTKDVPDDCIAKGIPARISL